MNIFFKKTTLIYVFVLLELLLFWLFKSSGDVYIGKSGESLNGFLREYGNYQFILAAYSPRIVLYASLAYPLLIIGVVVRGMQAPNFLASLKSLHLSLTTVLANITSFAILSGLFAILKNPITLIAHPYSWQSICYTLSPLIWCLYLYSICEALFPIQSFLRLLIKNWLLILPVFIFEMVFFNPKIMEALVGFWSNLLLVPTIELASGISLFFRLNYQLLPSLIDGQPVFGTNQFQVQISPACSGYEGLSLVVILLSGYLFIQRESLLMSRALLIVPLAGLMMFLLNGLRIFVLVAIGNFWSPQVAMDGFHIVAGWLDLLATFIFALFILSFPFFQKEEKRRLPLDLGSTILLIPLICLIVVGLLTKAITPDFAWLYPVHIVIATFVIYFFRKSFLLFLTRPSIISIAIGVLVFILWIVLIPENQEQSSRFMAELNAAPLWLAISWLLFRVMGASVIVPIAEEFAFRGYIQPQLELWFDRNGFKFGSVIASLGITALLFGYVHSNILAGSIAGLFFGLAYLQRRQLIDAIVAHAVTNSLLALYVLGFGYWSYW